MATEAPDHGPEPKDPRKRKAIRLIDILLGRVDVCEIHRDGPCGCVMIGAIDKKGRARFYPLNPGTCESSINGLPWTERHFWRKRISNRDPLEDEGDADDEDYEDDEPEE